MHTITINNPSDERLADYVGLRRADRRSRSRGVAVVESITVVQRVLESHLIGHVRSVLTLPSQLERVAALAPASGITVLVAERDVLAEVTGFDVHRGVLASMERPREPSLDEVLAQGSTLVMLEGLNDAENLGAISRTARALGAGALVLDPKCADPFARRVIRVSMGEVLFLPVVRSTDWNTTLRRVAERGVRIIALSPRGEVVLSKLVVHARRHDALLVGAEGPGLSHSSIALAHTTVRIPMHAGVDSVNVGHATAIALAHLQATFEPTGGTA